MTFLVNKNRLIYFVLLQKNLYKFSSYHIIKKNQLKCFLKLASKLSTSIFMKFEITSKFLYLRTYISVL